MLPPDLSQRLSFLTEIDKLKNVLRVNLLSDGSRRENTAEHSWHLATMVFVLAPYADGALELEKAMKMALIHDIVEIDAGDTYAFDLSAHHDKEERENKAAERLFGLLPRDVSVELIELWREFEAGVSTEARFVKALDRLNPFMQHMANEGVTWREKRMTRSLLMTRMGSVAEDCPALWPFLTQSVEAAIARGWIKDE